MYIIRYTYDETGKIIGLNYNNTQYYYIRNGQNDIIGILDSNFNQVVSYEYDSWGNNISIKDANGNEIVDSSNIGIINPYRYRSYRYDTETGLYYLNSRYYNPEWGRFINADNLVSTGQGILEHNMYAYCYNNPINMCDLNGNSAILNGALLGLTTAIGNAVVAVKNNIININTNEPPPPETGYKAPKSKSPVKKQPAPGSRSGEKGWPDRKGDIGVPDLDMHGGEGWRVHSPSGEHRHVYPNGKTRAHQYSSQICWDVEGYNLYEVTISGKKYLTDVPPSKGNLSNNFYFFPMLKSFPMIPSFSTGLTPAFGI